MTQLVKHAPRQQLLLRETPKCSVNISSGFATYGKGVFGWHTFYQCVTRNDNQIILTTIPNDINSPRRQLNFDLTSASPQMLQ
jgi:hypothetical protein